jgi:hypothetical protein
VQDHKAWKKNPIFPFAHQTRSAQQRHQQHSPWEGRLALRAGGTSGANLQATKLRAAIPAAHFSHNRIPTP